MEVNNFRKYSSQHKKKNANEKYVNLGWTGYSFINSRGEVVSGLDSEK
jgi:hypothetical protein